MFYTFKAIIVEGEIMEDIYIESFVRSASTKMFKIPNPISYSNNICLIDNSSDQWWRCTSDAVRVKLLTPLEGRNEGVFELSYRPLIVADETSSPHILEIMTQNLGTFKLQLFLRAIQTTERPRVQFNCALGSSDSQFIKIKTFNNRKTDFDCKLLSNEPSFIAPSILNIPEPQNLNDAWKGIQFSKSITFEPTDIGEIKDTLQIVSSEWGEYTIDLVGVCTPPEPQGPYSFNSKLNTTSISIFNCFGVNQNWILTTDSPYFHVSPSVLSIPCKTRAMCNVTFRIDDKIKGTITAKLHVQCKARPDIGPWIYYLKGTANV
jgi:hypothetical protein